MDKIDINMIKISHPHETFYAIINKLNEIVEFLNNSQEKKVEKNEKNKISKKK